MPLQPDRVVRLEAVPPLVALTATARGLIDGHFIRAAQRGYSELMTAVTLAGQQDGVSSVVAFLPDTPVGDNDARCRYVAGVLFGFDLARLSGTPQQPRIPLAGTLAWQAIPAGRYAVFRHRGPYEGLRAVWLSIWLQWLAASGERPHPSTAPMELALPEPVDGDVADRRTEIWVPLA